MKAVATALAACLRGATVTVGGKAILDKVDLEVRPEELLAIVGPNGAGKSTLLGVLAGDITAAGDVEVAGRPLSSWSRRELARHRAVLPQDNVLSFPFRAREVVEMGRAPWAGAPAADNDAEVVDAVMSVTETSDLAHRRYPSLSGGERARVALARVLAQDAAMLLLDEPTAALDLRHQELVLGVARQQAEGGKAVVAVIHDLDAAAAFADRVAVVDQGRVRAVGSARDVLTTALLSEVYRYSVTVGIDSQNHLVIRPARS